MWYGGEGKRRTLEFLEVGGDLLLLRNKSVGGGGGGGDGEGGGDGGREGSGEEEEGGGGGLQVFHFSAKVPRPSSFLSFFFFASHPLRKAAAPVRAGE